VGVALVLVLIVFGVHRLATSKPEQTKKVVQEIKVIRPPPPPPNVPPPPPPPPKDTVDVPDPQAPQPDPTPTDQAPPGEQLGVDADGTGGGDGFGLVGRKGGRDLLASGGSAFAWYAGQIKNQLLEELGKDPKIRSGSYSLVVKVWVKSDGSIERVALSNSSGDRDRDHLIEAAITRVGRISQGPPSGMPQPVSLRIASRA
jgi:type IV secretory pathway VirB10-like protein